MFLSQECLKYLVIKTWSQQHNTKIERKKKNKWSLLHPDEALFSKHSLLLGDHVFSILSFERLFCLITVKSSGEYTLLAKESLEGAGNTFLGEFSAEKGWWFRRKEES